MIPRIAVDLELGFQIARVLPELDLLDIAYAATRGGAAAVVVPLGAFVGANAQSPELFQRSGLPVFVVKCEMQDLDRIPGLGNVPDRILITGDRGKPVSDIAGATEMISRLAASGQEAAVLAEPEPAIVKEVSRSKASWIQFPTDTAFHSATAFAAEAEIARISSGAMLAVKLDLRVGLYGPAGRQLPAAFSSIQSVEEICPTPDLWSLALRLGWESSIAEFRRLMS